MYTRTRIEAMHICNDGTVNFSTAVCTIYSSTEQCNLQAVAMLVSIRTEIFDEGSLRWMRAVIGLRSMPSPRSNRFARYFVAMKALYGEMCP